MILNELKLMKSKSICVELVNVILNIIIVVSVIMKSRMFYRQTVAS